MFAFLTHSKLSLIRNHSKNFVITAFVFMSVFSFNQASCRSFSDWEIPIEIRQNEVDLFIKSPDYGDILKNPNLAFHGINLDISIIRSIFSFGEGFREVFDSDRIRSTSLALSPSHFRGSGHSYGAFRIYIRNSIGFVIDGLHFFKDRKFTEMPGEILVKEAIDPNQIIGIMLPYELIHKPISEINFVVRGAWGVSRIRCQFMYKFICQECGIEDPDLYEQIQVPIKSEEEALALEKIVNEFVLKGLEKKFTRSADKITFIEVIRSQLPYDVKIYDSKGFEIKTDAI